MDINSHEPCETRWSMRCLQSFVYKTVKGATQKYIKTAHIRSYIPAVITELPSFSFVEQCPAEPSTCFCPLQSGHSLFSSSALSSPALTSSALNSSTLNSTACNSPALTPSALSLFASASFPQELHLHTRFGDPYASLTTFMFSPTNGCVSAITSLLFAFIEKCAVKPPESTKSSSLNFLYSIARFTIKNRVTIFLSSAFIRMIAHDIESILCVVVWWSLLLCVGSVSTFFSMIAASQIFLSHESIDPMSTAEFAYMMWMEKIEDLTLDEEFLGTTMMVAGYTSIDDAICEMRNYEPAINEYEIYEDQTITIALSTYQNSISLLVPLNNTDEKNKKELKFLQVITDLANQLRTIVYSVSLQLSPLYFSESNEELRRRNLILQFYFYYVQTHDVVASYAKVNYRRNFCQEIIEIRNKFRALSLDLNTFVQSLVVIRDNRKPGERIQAIRNKWDKLQSLVTQFEKNRDWCSGFEDYQIAEFFINLHPTTVQKQVFFALVSFMATNPNQYEIKAFIETTDIERSLKQSE